MRAQGGRRIVISICASDIEKEQNPGDLGITYDVDVLRLIDAFRAQGLYVGSVVVTQYAGQSAADAFKNGWRIWGCGYFSTTPIAGYPNNIPLIVSDDGYGKNEHIETSPPPGGGHRSRGGSSGKMATCLSQLYHEHKRG